MNNKAFTLIETLIYIAILGIVISGFIVFAFSISDSRNKNYVVQEVQANARTALNLISQNILKSNGVNNINDSILELSMSDSGDDPTIINLNNNILYIKQGSADAVAVTSNEVKITNLVFTDLTSTSDKENIKIELTMEFNSTSTDPDFIYTQSWETAVNLRQ